jgi:hypothetical protein
VSGGVVLARAAADGARLAPGRNRSMAGCAFASDYSKI